MTTVTQEILWSSTTDSTAITITLASLATSSGRVAGRQSDIVSLVSGKYEDVHVFGNIRTGTSPTTGQVIQISVFYPTKFASSTFSYPYSQTTMLTESDAARTFDAEQLYQLRHAVGIQVNGTSDRDYPFWFNLQSIFGGTLPPKFGLFIAHDTAVNLNSTAGNHWVHWIGVEHTLT